MDEDIQMWRSMSRSSRSSMQNITFKIIRIPLVYVKEYNTQTDGKKCQRQGHMEPYLSNYWSDLI